MKTVFDNGRLVVETNDSGEMFVSTKESPGRKGYQPKIRISDNGGQGLSITAMGCNWNPTAFDGLGGFYVTHQQEKPASVGFSFLNKIINLYSNPE